MAVLEIRVALKDGQTVFREVWHNNNSDHKFKPPRLPDELAGLPLATLEMPPHRDEYCGQLDVVNREADKNQFRFKFAAVVIIVTHTIATILATITVAFHLQFNPHDIENAHLTAHEMAETLTAQTPFTFMIAPILLTIEIGLLSWGFKVHRDLHHSRASRVWAVSRLVAQFATSLRAIGNRHLYLDYLFHLSLPHHFRPLLRTLNVLHLRSTRGNRDDPWQPMRKQYIERRFDHPDEGQVPFYQRRLKSDEFWLNFCQWVFTSFSALAIFAVLGKLALMNFPQWLGHSNEFCMHLLATLAIVFPVIAVGGLSWAAALDREARIETFSETLSFLERQRPYLEQADTVEEFDFLLLETETELLGEVANWFSRRSTTGVN
jgi:hypothetical protein